MSFWSSLKSLFSKSTTIKAEKKDFFSVDPQKPSEATEQDHKHWSVRPKVGSKKEQQLATLQAGYREMLELVKAIRSNLDKQSDVQERMTSVLEKLPTSLDHLKEVTRAADQQVEVLGMLRQQLDNSIMHDEKLTESMKNFNETLGLMNNTSRQTSTMINTFADKSSQSEKSLQEMVKQSERRIIGLAIFFALLFAAFAGGTGYLLYRSGFISFQPPVEKAASTKFTKAIDADKPSTGLEVSVVATILSSNSIPEEALTKTIEDYDEPVSTNEVENVQTNEMNDAAPEGGMHTNSTAAVTHALQDNPVDAE